MRIEDLKSTIVGVPYTEPEPWAWGVGHYGVNSILVELSTNEGITGIGEGTTFHSEIECGKLITDSARKFLVGEDPFDIERIMRRLWGAGFTDHQVMAGIEMALWDAMGKACRKPLYKLLGGAYNKEIPFAAWINRKKPQDMAKDAIAFAKQGFHAFNIKVGIDAVEDIEAVKSVREAVDDKCEIRVDANMAWAPNVAIKMIKKLERCDITFAEDPTYSRAMARVMKAVDTPICSGASTVQEISRVIADGSADIIGHIDPKLQGGIMNSKKACVIAEMACLPVVLHAGSELGISNNAMLHIVASTPNFLFPNQTYYMYLADDVCKGGLQRFQNGCMKVPEGPGLGAEIDRDKVEKYSQLHKQQGGFSIYEEHESKGMKKILPHQTY